MTSAAERAASRSAIEGKSPALTWAIRKETRFIVSGRTREPSRSSTTPSFRSTGSRGSERASRSWIDDSKATNVNAAVTAVSGLPEPKAVLIAGGRDKLGTYEPLVDALRRKGRALVLLGEAADRIAAAAQGQLPIERDPPEHTEYRKIVEPFFKRAKDPAVAAEVGLHLGEFDAVATNLDLIVDAPDQVDMADGDRIKGSRVNRRFQYLVLT